MALPVVVISLIAVTTCWCATVLSNEELYVRAVTPLGTSRRFTRLAGRSVAVSIRRRCRDIPMIHVEHTEAVGAIVRWSMSTRPFAASWPHLQRGVHRRYIRGGLPISKPRLAVIMVFLATAGTAVRVGQRIMCRSAPVGG